MSRAGSGSAIARVVGSPDGFIAPARRRIEPCDLAYARDCRGKGWGWQAIAHQLRLNQTDLRMALGDLEAPPPPPKAPEPTKPLGHGMKTSAAVLLAVQAGAANLIDAALMTGRPTRNVSVTAAKLRNQGLLNGWALTAAGAREAKAWAREAADA